MGLHIDFFSISLGRVCLSYSVSAKEIIHRIAGSPSSENLKCCYSPKELTLCSPAHSHTPRSCISAQQPLPNSLLLSYKMTKKKDDASTIRDITSVSAFLLHSISGLGLAVSFWAAHSIYNINLISQPLQTLRLICIVEAPLVILMYSLFRQNPAHCPYWEAVLRGIIGLPVGALCMAFGAIVLGAPVVIPYLKLTVYWSLLMSLFTFVPTASVYGSSSKDWRRLFAYTKPTGTLDYIICIPAHGAVIGAWFGAWPMPLDWERPWQEWPICVTYGAVAGYMVGMVVSMGFILVCSRSQQRIKRE